MPDLIKMATVCERMSWTYNDYKSQPNWFIETLILKWETESEVAKNNKNYGKQQSS